MTIKPNQHAVATLPEARQLSVSKTSTTVREIYLEKGGDKWRFTPLMKWKSFQKAIRIKPPPRQHLPDLLHCLQLTAASSSWSSSVVYQSDVDRLRTTSRSHTALFFTHKGSEPATRPRLTPSSTCRHYNNLLPEQLLVFSAAPRNLRTPDSYINATPHYPWHSTPRR